MQFIILFLCLLLVGQLHSVECTDVVASCDTTCKCDERTVSLSSKEYRAVCKGDGTERVVVTDKLFQTESVPDMTRTSYVRIEGFRGAKIAESFLSKWLAYTSCSFDIWNSGRIAFPKSVSKMARTKALTFVFAGIGVLNSSIEELPDNIFKRRSVIGLKFVKSQIDNLNLFKLAAKKINYVKVNNSLIKIFDGKPTQSLTLARSFSKGEGKIIIHNSEIHYLSKDALSFNDYKSRSKAIVQISESTIGIVETSAIHIGRNISLEIKDSKLNQVMPGAFSFVGDRIFPSSITRNFLGLDDNSLKQLKCDSSLQIEDNIIKTRQMFTGCNLGSYQDDSLPPCNASVKLSDYLDSSCGNNLVNGEYCLVLQSFESTAVTTGVNGLALESSYDALSSNNISESPGRLTLSHNMLYVMIGLFVLLIVIVISLIWALIYGKMKGKKDEILYMDESILYEEPTSFNSRKGRPKMSNFPMNEIKKREEERTEQQEKDDRYLEFPAQRR